MVGLTSEQIKEIRKEFDSCTRPLIYFDDDADGLCSFLQVYRYIKDGKGVVIKTSPDLSEVLANKIDEYDPDLIIILDKPSVSEDFFKRTKGKKVIWIDHHAIQKVHGIKYYNPKMNDKDDNMPVSYLCYQILKQDLWIAATGVIADWFFPKDIVKKLRKEYPDLLTDDIDTPPKALFESRIGKLAKIFNFILKTNNNDVMKCVKILTRIQDPEEILSKTTAQGKFVYKQFEKLNKKYESMLDDAKKQAKEDDKILLYQYKDNNFSLTSEFSNELLYNFPDKIIVVGREKNGDIKMSLRSSNIEIPPILKKALEKTNGGYGGGHPNACGGCVKKSDFEDFLNDIREQIKDE